MATTALQDHYLNDFQQFRDGFGDEPAWLRTLRQEAMAHFAELGFPTARHGNERWKYTDVRPIAEARFHYNHAPSPGATQNDLQRVAPWDCDWPRLVFVDGRFSAELSFGLSATPGLQVMPLGEALKQAPADLELRLGRYAPAKDDGFVALNSAFFGDGAFVRVSADGGPDLPIHLVYLSSGRDPLHVSYPRSLIIAEPQSRFAVVETYAAVSGGRYFTDAVTEVFLAEGAQIELSSLLLESPDAFHVSVNRVHQERDSAFTSFAFARGAGIGRRDLHVALAAPGASATLKGLYLTRERERLDNAINIEHIQPHTTSRLYYKGILDGQSHAVFGGTVFVHPGAVKSDAEQVDKNLLLSAEAEIDSKPSLEIYADDVKCSHGATAGAIAEDALFYMLSRGLDQETAMSFLIEGFAGEILEAAQPRPLRDFLTAVLASALKTRSKA